MKKRAFLYLLIADRVLRGATAWRCSVQMAVALSDCNGFFRVSLSSDKPHGLFCGPGDPPPPFLLTVGKGDIYCRQILSGTLP